MRRVILMTLVALTLLAYQENKEAVSSATGPNKEQKVKVKPFSNPQLIYGSSFGQLFSIYYKQSKYKEMICFTSKESIRCFGRETILHFYKTGFKLDFEIGNLRAIQHEGDTTNLIYEASIFATKRKIIIPVVLENDSVKFLLTSLKSQW